MANRVRPRRAGDSGARRGVRPTYGHVTLDAPRRAPPDVAKGSYYNNPSHDRPTEDAELMKRFPAYCMPNVWPEGGDCPELEPAFKALGQLIVDVGGLVGDQIDRFAAKAVAGYPSTYLGTVIRTSLDCKVRMCASPRTLAQAHTHALTGTHTRTHAHTHTHTHTQTRGSLRWRH